MGVGRIPKLPKLEGKVESEGVVVTPETLPCVEEDIVRPYWSPGEVLAVKDNEDWQAIRNGTTIPGVLDKNDVVDYRTPDKICFSDGAAYPCGGERGTTTVDHFVNSDDIVIRNIFSNHQTKNRMVINRAVGGDLSASAKLFDKSGQTFIRKHIK